jgi:hypothetical protein
MIGEPPLQSTSIPAEDFVDVFGCGLFLAVHAPILFDTSEIERNARNFFG